MIDKVYLNGRFVAANKATVSVFDRGLNYGDGLFETILAREGEPVFFKEHIVRLKRGAGTLSIRTPLLKLVSSNAPKAPVKALLRKNNLLKGDAYLKIVLTRGEGLSGHLPQAGREATLIITACGIKNGHYERLRSKGVSAILLDLPYPTTPGIKSLNFLPNIIAKKEANKRGAYEGIFVNKEGKILEGSSTNIFIIKGNTLKTPPLELGILPGITRSKVLGLALKMGLKVKEGPFKERDLLNAQEAFLTNSIIEILPLVKVNKVKIREGHTGLITQEILKAYSERA